MPSDNENFAPRANEMEAAILGRLMVDPSPALLEQVRDRLNDPDDFAPTLNCIFKHIRKLADEGKPWNVIAVRQSLTDSGELSYIGDAAYLNQMTTDIPRGLDISREIEMVADFRDRRKFIDVFNKGTNAAISGKKTALQLRKDFQKWLSKYESSDTVLPKIICINDVEAQEAEWLAHPYIPIGKVTMLEGDPGIGKSHVSLAFAAGVAAGFGLPGQKQRTEPRSVLIASVEDGIADTIRPRLDRMGAHVERIFAIDEPFTFDLKGLLLLETAIAQHHAVLVIIDPIQGFVGSGVDIHRTNETRPIMARLAEIANRQRCAILCIRHLTKANGGKAIYRGIGSIDFSAAVRSILLAGCDPDNPSRRAVVQTKNNLAMFGEPIGYEINEEGFFWTGKSDLTDFTILGARTGDENREERSAIEDASEFLMSCLKDGPAESDELKAQAKKAGIAWATVRRAKGQLRVRSRKTTGTFGVWQWELPQGDRTPTDEHLEHVEQNERDNSSKVSGLVQGAQGAHQDAQRVGVEHVEHLTLSSSKQKPYRNGIIQDAQGAHVSVSATLDLDEDYWEGSDDANT